MCIYWISIYTASGRPFFLRATRGERKVSIMQITGQNEEEIGAGRGKRTIAEVLLYFELQFQWNGNSDWSPTCKSVNNKNLSVPKESNFHGGFCSTWRTDTFCKLHSSFQMEAQVFKESSCFCGTWTIFEVKIFPLSRTIEIFSTWQWEDNFK